MRRGRGTKIGQEATFLLRPPLTRGGEERESVFVYTIPFSLEQEDGGRKKGRRREGRKKGKEKESLVRSFVCELHRKKKGLLRPSSSSSSLPPKPPPSRGEERMCRKEDLKGGKEVAKEEGRKGEKGEKSVVRDAKKWLLPSFLPSFRFVRSCETHFFLLLPFPPRSISPSSHPHLRSGKQGARRREERRRGARTGLGTQTATFLPRSHGMGFDD